MANRQAQQRLLQDTGVRPGSTPAVGARTLLHTDLPAFTWYQARRMMREPAVRTALDYIKGPIHQMTVEIGPPDPMAPPKPGPKLRVIAPHPIVATYLAKNLDILWDQELSKLLRCIEDGVSFAAVEYERRGGSVYVSYLRELDPEHTRVLIDPKTGQVSGLRWKQLHTYAEQSKTDTILTKGKWISVVHRPEYSHYYGCSHMLDAFDPFLELHGPSGCKEIIRTWFYRCAAMGFRIRYPEGQTLIGDREVPNIDLARQFLDHCETGSNFTFPNNRDEQGNYLWDIEQPQINGDGRSFLEYRQELRKEIMLGMGITPEVVEAQETTGALAGRRVPQLAFYSSLQCIVKELIQGISACILDRLVEIEYGRKIEYRVEADNLLPHAPEPPPGMMQAGPPGAPPEGPPPAAEGGAA